MTSENLTSEYAENTEKAQTRMELQKTSVSSPDPDGYRDRTGQVVSL